MKKYPYTDSTDIIIYESKKKKNKKSKTWLACLSSAVAASLLTGAIFTAGAAKYLNTSSNGNTNSPIAMNAGDVSNLSTNTGSKQELTIPEIAAKVGPSCVGVINKTKITPQRYYDPFTGRYFYTSDPNNDELQEQGSGSGIIISTDGYIVTNQHVIDGATEISVILNTGDEYVAKLVGADSKSDLAVLKIDKSGLPAATLGNSDELQVGELAVAIGNPLGQEFAGSVTSGVISALNRTMTVENKVYNLVQTDAAINPGNSGGALVNKYGEVIGINTIKLSSTEVEGIGFAIAITEAKPIIDDLMSNGYVSGRPSVGIFVSENRSGLTVEQIAEGSGAEAAGIQIGDLIVKADGKTVKTSKELNEIRDKKSPNDILKLTVIRNGELLDVDVKLGEDIPDNANE
jgi:serine protease Do